MKCYFKHGRSRGLRLVRFRAWQLELWWVPVGEVIEPHTHPNIHSWLWFLKGECMVGKSTSFFRAEEKLKLFHTYVIPYFMTHWFNSVTKSLLFLNFQQWRSGVVPTSASVDFEILEN